MDNARRASWRPLNGGRFKLTSVEILDLGEYGSAGITALTPAQVRDILGGAGTLTIDGGESTTVELGAGWTGSGGSYSATVGGLAIDLAIDSQVNVVIL